MAAAACTADDRRALRGVTETLSSMAATPPKRLPAGARSQRSLRPCALWLAPPSGRAAERFNNPKVFGIQAVRHSVPVSLGDGLTWAKPS
jgi:hypothetical protein